MLTKKEAEILKLAIIANHVSDEDDGRTSDEMLDGISNGDVSIWDPLEDWDNDFLVEHLTSIFYHVDRVTK